MNYPQTNTGKSSTAIGGHLRTQRGVGLIEVLITVFVLAIGLLGVASLQFVGSFSNKEALFRTQAVMVAQQMSERMRASTVASVVTDGFVVHNNYFVANNYNFANLTCNSDLSDYDCHCLEIPEDVPDCQSSECNAGEIAVFDAYQMSCSAVKENADALVGVTCDDADTDDADACTAGSILTIQVSWPALSWKDDTKFANANCNDTNEANFDCVVKEVTL